MNWTVFDRLTELARAYLLKVDEERQRLLEIWGRLLDEFGGDPSTRDWSRFRPLRLSREEDWSDWLAHLLESSRTEMVAQALFWDSSAMQQLGCCVVTREEATLDSERRGDIVIRWDPGLYVHVEVKVGDMAFEKTIETGRKLHRRHTDAKCWKNFVLMPSEDVDGWRESKECTTDSDDDEKESEFEELTWDGVAVAIRQALVAKKENLVWRAWAYAFIGAVEQQILEHPVVSRGDCLQPTTQLAQLDRMARQTEVLRKGLEHV